LHKSQNRYPHIKIWMSNGLNTHLVESWCCSHGLYIID